MSGGKPADGHYLYLKQVNLFLLHQRIDELITMGPVGDDFVFSEALVLELHGIVMREILERPGEYRRIDVEIRHADHVPPPWQKVPDYMSDLVGYVNKNWATRDLVHLAAFVMWRLCWIHPFVNGNGRTARGTSYLVLNAKYGQHLPPKNSIIEQIVHDEYRMGGNAPYYKALGAVDQEHKKCETGCSDCDGECACSRQMEDMLLDHLKKQIHANL